MNNATQKYSKPAIILHWLTGLLILAMFGLGWFMADIPKDLPKTASLDVFDLGLYTQQYAEAISPRTFYFNLHKSLGVTLFVLLLVRVYIRFTQPHPPFLSSMQAWEVKLADLVHKGLYVLMLAMPLAGIIMSLNSKYGLAWFGVPVLPGLDNEGLRDIFKELHEFIGLVLIAVIVLHVVAAIKHKLIDKDGTMERMSLK